MVVGQAKKPYSEKNDEHVEDPTALRSQVLTRHYDPPVTLQDPFVDEADKEQVATQIERFEKAARKEDKDGLADRSDQDKIIMGEEHTGSQYDPTLSDKEREKAAKEQSGQRNEASSPGDSKKTDSTKSSSPSTSPAAKADAKQSGGDSKKSGTTSTTGS